jgi:hypothetical protein
VSAQQQAIVRLRSSVAEIDDELVEFGAQIAATRAAGRQAAARGDADGVTRAAGAEAMLAERQRGAQGRREAAVAQVTAARTTLLDGVGDVFAPLDGRVPLLLLPVRLETRFAWLDPANPRRHRFVADGATTPVLLVRIYPDDLHVDGHDPHLTAQEARWQAEWLRQIQAGRDLIDFVNAWSELIARAGPRRAAWIAHASRRPRRPVAADRLGRPARAALLPDRWLAVARTDASEYSASSNLVAEELAVTLDPGAPAGAAGSLGWLTDFDAALAAGMAVRIPLAPGLVAPAVRRLVVVGACASLDADAAADALVALIDAHHYTAGISFLRPGTPTNAAPDQRAGLGRSPSAREVFDVEGDMFPLVAPARTLVDNLDCDAVTAARLLGIDPATFGHVAGADMLTGLASQDLRTILAYATLPHLRRLAGTNLHDDDWQLAQSLFVGGPGALGPVPTLRVGNQPYGLLPVAVRAGGDSDLAPGTALGRLVGLLDRLRDEIWEPAAARVPRIGAAGVDPAVTLLDVLRSDGVARGLLARAALPPGVAAAVQATIGLPAEVAAARQALSDQLANLGASAVQPPLADLVHLTSAAPLTVALVEPEGAAGVNRFGEYLRILALRDLLGWCNLHDLAIGNYANVGGRPTPFLFALARAALLTSADLAARRMLADAGIDPAWVTAWDGDTSDEVLGFDAPLYALADRLMERWPDPSGTGVHVWLTSNTPPGEAGEFLTVRGAVTRLAVPSPTPGAVQTHDPQLVDTVLRAELGLLTHRLDAWYTIVATERLWQARSGQPSGLAVGAFGVLEQILPTTITALPSAAGLPADLTGPVFADATNAGFVHAPSAAHAATAAVLRSAHLAHHALGRTAARREAFAVELSSRRVRNALEVVDGLREGQPLGALLGYRIERRLLADAPQAVAVVRRAAPLVANKLHPSNAPAETVAADNVVDGLALLAAAGYGTTSDVDAAALRATLDLSAFSPTQSDAVVTAVTAAVREALDVCDAVADLTLAEGVHQLVQGNPLRSGGAVDSVAGTEASMPDPAVAATPRSGAGIVHRLMVVLDAGPTTVPDTPRGWAASPRALLAPALERWARTLLPDPEHIGVRIEATDAAGAVTVTAATLADLHAAAVDAGFGAARLGALDLAASERPWADPDDPAAPALSEASSLGARLRLCARQHLGQGAVAVRLLGGRDGAWPSTTVTVAEAVHLAAALRDLIGQARPLLPADLAAPGATPAASLDLSRLAARVDAAAQAASPVAATLSQAAGTAEAHLADPSAANHAATVAGDRAQLTAALLAADAFGVLGALPTDVDDTAVGVEAATATLAATARSVGQELAGRIDALAAVAPAAAGADATGRLAAQRARAEALFGPGAMVTADVVPADGDPFAPGRRPLGASDAQARLFCGRAARVRAGAARLDLLSGLVEALQGRSLPLAVTQVPFPGAADDGGAPDVDPARWVALPAPPGKRVPAGRASIVAQLPFALTAPLRLCGLTVDEWVEVVPASHETTSVAFHYDAPSSAPPNVMLLTAHPPGFETWSSADAVGTADEALALARLRAVDPQVLDQPAPPIAGLVTQENTAGDVAALDIATLTNPPGP